MEAFRKILYFGFPYKIYAGLNIFFNMLYALFSALAFIAFIPMLNVLFETTERINKPPVYKGIMSLEDYIKDGLNFLISKKLEEDIDMTLVIVVALVLVLFLLKNLSNYLAMYFITFLRNGILKDLRNALYKKIISLPVAYFSEKRKGDLMARLTTDVNEIQVSFLSILELVVREPLTIIFTLIIMFRISTDLSLFVLIFIPVSGVIISSIGKRLKKHSEKVQKEQGDFLSIIDETVNGQKIIKTFGAGKHFIDRFHRSTNRFFNFSNKLLHRTNLAAPTSEFLGITVIGVLLWFGGRMVLIDQALSGTTFIVYMGLAYNILTPAKGISKAIYSVQKGNAAAERVLEILMTENTLKDAPDALEKNDLRQAIVFKNIVFSYAEKNIIQNISFTIEKGQTIALVGSSGSGKTTIANLLNRFYDIDSGALLIDETPISKIKKESLYDMIGIVTQEAILFNDSIINNLRIGKQNASKEEIITAAKVANAHEFITQLSNGYDTNIGESGNKLSGGQKQRLSIARAILKNPKILILDEATSALDTESEKLVQDALENLMQKRTSLVIAHRLSTIQKADKIMVIQNGSIIESGTHQTLMNKSAVYKNLVALQRL